MIAKLGRRGLGTQGDSGEGGHRRRKHVRVYRSRRKRNRPTRYGASAAQTPGQQLIVAGCLRAALRRAIAIAGSGNRRRHRHRRVRRYRRCTRRRARGAPPGPFAVRRGAGARFLPRLVTTPKATAYLKIAEGCDHPCTFCIIPKLRGKFRSRSEESILKEAAALAAAGTKEADSSSRKIPRCGAATADNRRGGFAQAARAIARNRRHRVDPSALSVSGDRGQRTDRRDGAFAQSVQVHGYAAAARACGRAARDASPEQRRAVSGDYRGVPRTRVPGITMRSTFIVGFPGETQEHVEYLEEWIGRRAARPRRVLRI